MNAVKYIALYMAGLIILMHALIPHQHEESMSAEAHQKLHSETTSLLDDIALALHESHDQGDLDFFDLSDELPVQEITVNYIPVLTALFSLPNESVNVVEYIAAEHVFVPREEFVPLLANRPPPSII